MSNRNCKHDRPNTLRNLRDFTDAELTAQIMLLTPKVRLVECRFRDTERNLTFRLRNDKPGF